MATVPLLRCCLGAESLHVVTGRRLQPGADPAADALLDGAQRGQYPLFVLFPGADAEDLAGVADSAEHGAALARAGSRAAPATTRDGTAGPGQAALQADRVDGCVAPPLLAPRQLGLRHEQEGEEQVEGVAQQRSAREEQGDGCGSSTSAAGAEPVRCAGASGVEARGSGGGGTAGGLRSASETRSPAAHDTSCSAAEGATHASHSASGSHSSAGGGGGGAAGAVASGLSTGTAALAAVAAITAEAEAEAGGASETSGPAPGASGPVLRPAGAQAADSSCPPPAYVLLVIDGTWKQAREMYRAVAPRCLPPDGPGRQVALKPADVLPHSARRTSLTLAPEPAQHPTDADTRAPPASATRPEGSEGLRRQDAAAAPHRLEEAAAHPSTAVEEAGPRSAAQADAGIGSELVGKGAEAEQPADYNPDMPCLIRKEPVAGYVTTYEAAARAVGLLERDPQLTSTLLAPLRLLTRLQAEFSPSILSRMRAEPEPPRRQKAQGTESPNAGL